MLMKKFLTAFCAALLLLVLFVNCSGNNKTEEIPQEETMSLSAADTTKVMELMNQYFGLLLNKDYDGAMAMVSQFRNDSLIEMTPELEQHYQMGMKIIAPIRYELESMFFNTESDCLVKYSAVLFDKDGEDDNRPNKMFYAIKPVRLNGEWHLTVADDADVNTRISEIEKY